MAFALEHTERRGEYVFYGRAKDPRDDSTEWKRLLVKPGICDATMKDGDMPELAAARTTTGTLLRDAGVDATIVRDMLGQSHVSVTQESYMRTVLEGLGGGGLKLEQLLGVPIRSEVLDQD